MGALCCLLIGSFYLSGFLPGLVFLCVAFDLLASGQGMQGAPARTILLVAAISPILGFYTLGLLLDCLAFPQLPRRFFSSFMLAAGATMPFTPEFLRSLERLGSLQTSQVLPVITKLSSAVFFCAGLSAAVLLALCMAGELPFLWFTGKFKVHLAELAKAFRPLAIGTMLALGINLIFGLFQAEFNLFRILGDLI